MRDRLCGYGWIHERFCGDETGIMCGSESIAEKAAYFAYGTNETWIYVRTPLQVIIPRNKEMETVYMKDLNPQKQIDILLIFLQIRDDMVSMYKFEVIQLVHEPGLGDFMLTVKNPCTERGLVVPRHALAVEVRNVETLQCVWKCHWKFMRVPWNARMIESTHDIGSAVVDNMCRPIPENFVSVRWSINVGRLHNSYGVIGDAWLELADEVSAMIQANFSLFVTASACTIKGAVTDSPDYDFMLNKFSSQGKQHHSEFEIHENADFLFTDDGEWERVMDCLVLTKETDIQPSHASRSVSQFMQSLSNSDVFVRHGFEAPSSLEHDIQSVSRLAPSVEIRHPTVDLILQRLLVTIFEMFLIAVTVYVYYTKKQKE